MQVIRNYTAWLMEKGFAALSPEERAERRVKRIWWNRDRMIEFLSLGEEQRKKMDQAFMARAKETGAATSSFAEDQAALASALQNGDWAGARAAGKRVAQQTAKMSEAELETKIAILSLLTAEQRAKLGERPGILRGGWARTMPAVGPMGPAMRGGARSPGSKAGAASDTKPAGDAKKE